MKEYLNDICGTKSEKIEAPKYDDGKLRWDLLPFECIEELVKIYTYGAQKYSANGWKSGLSFSRIIAAVFRHIASWMLGEQRDKESGLLHLAHAGWGILTLIWYEKYKSEFDDRKLP